MEAGELKDIRLCVKAWRNAVESGYAEESEHSFWEWQSLAASALRRGDEPGALFWWAWKNHAFECVTQEDEEEARRRWYEVNGWVARNSGMESIGSIVFRILREVRGEEAIQPQEQKVLPVLSPVLTSGLLSA